ncbi:MAG: HDOD domain-containing protein [Gammaproteobacteria bacterium]|nr:HDOD domain-containing protein [Gammaproteobacteria bacterium]
MPDIFLARQPIFDVEYNLHGYELLYRDGFNDSAVYDSADLATSKVMLSSVIDIGIEKITSGHDCYINICDDYIDDIEDIFDIPFGSLAITFELDISKPLSDKHFEVLTRLSSEGIKLAIDHFKPEKSSAAMMQLFDVIKCDTQSLTQEQLIQSAQVAKQHNCKIIGTNIEDYQQIPNLINLGVDYLQGFFLSRPDTTSQKSVPTILLPVIKTLSRILDPELDLTELEALISSDVSFSYRVLRLVNSAGFNIDEINSISRAIVYLGRDAIKKLAIIIVLTGVDDKPTELSKLALIRGKMCEILAEQVGAEDANSYFTVGLLSVLDAMLDQSMEHIIDELAISNELRQALLLQGFMGKTLQCVIDYEKCCLNKNKLNEINELDSSELSDYYIRSIEWAEQTFSGLSL